MEEELPINTYETVIVFDAKLHENKLKFLDFFMSTTGKKLAVKYNDIGIKKLAYDIKEHNEGYFVTYYWRGTEQDVIEAERLMRIDDTVLKFITVKHNPEDLDFTWMEEDAKSEQDDYDPNTQVDAYDVLLGFAEYKK